MSHEIRTPMNAIIGLSDLALHHQPLDSTIRDYLEKIHRSSISLLGILNDILDYSKIESGRMSIENGPFNLDVLLDNLRNLFVLRAEEKSLDFVIEVAAAVPRQLVGDGLRLQQILVNLLGNAVKFTEHGRVALRISVQALEPTQAYLIFRVEDTGIGIPRDMVTLLFQPFIQADSSISRRFGGTGLGLAISRELLLLMGSDCTVESTVGQGSAFTFRLLLGVMAETPSHAQNALVDDPIHYRGSARILVVEDNPINQQVISELLKRWGLTAVIANHGKEALNHLASERFDVVLMDIHMPEMDGLETTRRIRQGMSGQDLPIIALTAGVTPQERNSALISGMNCFVGKPINQEELANALMRWIPLQLKNTQNTSQASLPLARNNPHELNSNSERIKIDLRNLREIFKDQNGIFDILGKFSIISSDDLNEINQAILINDLKQVKAVSHRLKGAAGNVGAVDLHRAVAKLDAELLRALCANMPETQTT
ncbi:two-component system, sensor histidine kinase [Gammaproteobacteria bacterium]